MIVLSYPPITPITKVTVTEARTVALRQQTGSGMIRNAWLTINWIISRSNYCYCFYALTGWRHGRMLSDVARDRWLAALDLFKKKSICMPGYKSWTIAA